MSLAHCELITRSPGFKTYKYFYSEELYDNTIKSQNYNILHSRIKHNDI